MTQVNAQKVSFHNILQNQEYSSSIPINFLNTTIIFNCFFHLKLHEILHPNTMSTAIEKTEGHERERFGSRIAFYFAAVGSGTLTCIIDIT